MAGRLGAADGKAHIDGGGSGRCGGCPRNGRTGRRGSGHSDGRRRSGHRSLLDNVPAGARHRRTACTGRLGSVWSRAVQRSWCRSETCSFVADAGETKRRRRRRLQACSSPPQHPRQLRLSPVVSAGAGIAGGEAQAQIQCPAHAAQRPAAVSVAQARAGGRQPLGGKCRDRPRAGGIALAAARREQGREQWLWKVEAELGQARSRPRRRLRAAASSRAQRNVFCPVRFRPEPSKKKTEEKNCAATTHCNSG
jgi:hypothetical protein